MGDSAHERTRWTHAYDIEWLQDPDKDVRNRIAYAVARDRLFGACRCSPKPFDITLPKRAPLAPHDGSSTDITRC